MPVPTTLIVVAKYFLEVQSRAARSLSGLTELPELLDICRPPIRLATFHSQQVYKPGSDNDLAIVKQLCKQLHFGVRDEWIIVFWNWYWLSVDIIMSFGNSVTGFVFINPVLGVDAIIFGFVRMNVIWESLDHITMHTTMSVEPLDEGRSAVIHVDTKFQLA